MGDNRTQMMPGYFIELVPDDNGTLLVTCPSLPEVTTYGADSAEAEARAISAIEEALAARIKDGSVIPPWADQRPTGRNWRFVTLPLSTTPSRL